MYFIYKSLLHKFTNKGILTVSVEGVVIEIQDGAAVSPLSQIWTITNHAIERVSLDPRVHAWMESAAAGLASRRAEGNKITDEDAFIRTHRVPLEVLNLVFHEEYSRSNRWQENPLYTSRICLLKIDNVIHKV